MVAGSPAEARRFDDARKLYATNKYLPAAERFEGLHADTQNPQYLYYAGLAREGAEHDAHAIRHWQQALRLGLDRDFTAKAQAHLDQARLRTTALTVTVAPAALADGATLELRATTGQRQTIVVPLTDLPVHLEPGTWAATLTPRDPGFQPLELRLTIVRGTSTLVQEFRMKAIEHLTTFEFTPTDAPLTGLVLTLQDPKNLARSAVKPYKPGS